MEAIGRRILGLAAIAILCVTLNPTWAPSQTRFQYEMETTTKRLDRLETGLQTVPTDIAVMKEQIRRQGDAIETLSNRGLGLLLGILAWAGREMFKEFGGKERRTRTT